MDYVEIKDEKDIDNLMRYFNFFHDSCIKELKYISGGYVSDCGAMYPFNSIRSVSIIFQSQLKKVIELKFEGVHKLNLVPRGEDYDCIIYEACLKNKDNLFYWCEWRDSIESDNTLTWILAEQLSWKSLDEEYLGAQEIYKKSYEEY